MNVGFNFKQKSFVISKQWYFLSLPDPSEVCSFTKTGKTYNHEDHYYQCDTCDMGTSGWSICTPCIKTCHANHVVKYVRNGRHFCDCGERGKEKCQILEGNFTFILLLQGSSYFQMVDPIVESWQVYIEISLRQKDLSFVLSSFLNQKRRKRVDWETSIK